MRISIRSILVITSVLVLLNINPWNVSAQDEPVEEEFELTREELDALLTRVDRFFIDQDMASLTVDVDIYRDPSNRLNEQNIRQEDPSQIAGLTTLISHYTYRYPGFYELKIMGEILAGSDIPQDATFFSQLIPLPGAPIYSEEIQERYYIRFEALDELDGVPVYRIRYSSLDRENEFFDWLVYYIEVEREVILKVDTTFDNTWYVGSGRGTFYYDDYGDYYLPVYGHGNIFFQPNRSFNIWGRWYSWDWLTPEEAGIDDAETEVVEGDEVDSDPVTSGGSH